MNPGPYRLHRGFFIGIVAFAVIMLLMGASMLLRHQEDAAVGLIGLGFLPIALAHWFAARGAKAGKTSGRTLSRIIATLWLFGFPVGTALGIYVWKKTGSDWQESG